MRIKMKADKGGSSIEVGWCSWKLLLETLKIALEDEEAVDRLNHWKFK